MKTPLPASLEYLNARELCDFLRRSFREKSKREAETVMHEIRRRGMKITNADLGQYRRLTQ